MPNQRIQRAAETIFQQQLSKFNNLTFFFFFALYKEMLITGNTVKQSCQNIYLLFSWKSSSSSKPVFHLLFSWKKTADFFIF